MKNVSERASTWVLILMIGAGTAVAGNEDRIKYLGDLENEVFREINLARSDPDQYATFVAAWIPHFDGRVRRLPDRPAIQTQEGADAVREAVRFLEDTRPVDVLRPSQGMSLGARDHVANMGPRGALGHTGRDGSSFGDRINRHGKWKRLVGENITYGGDIAREIVIRLIVDDGIEDRGHRTNLFDPDYEVIGVACGSHKLYDTMCVMTFAGDYIEE